MNTACIVVSIDNAVAIEQVFGSSVLSSLQRLLIERARQLCAKDHGSVAQSGRHLLLVLRLRPYSPYTKMQLASHVQTLLGEVRLSSLLGTVIPVLSVELADMSGEPFDIRRYGAKTSLNSFRTNGSDTYLDDMQECVQLMCALDEGQLSFAYEAILDERGCVVYQEALLRQKSSENGATAPAGIAAMERLQLIRRLDHWVVSSVVKELHNAPGVRLGCNISARSAALDPWWWSLIDLLQTHRDVASRLVIEITETTAIDSFEETRAFVSKMRSIGCSVALDDVGRGFHTLESVIGLGVDIIKLDRSYTWSARRCEDARTRLASLISFAKTCAQHVVMEGIECDEDILLARSMDSVWLQGYRCVATTIDQDAQVGDEWAEGYRNYVCQ